MSEFIAVVAWKTRGRQVPRALTNTEGRTVETTGVALSAEDEHLRIGALRTLDGVEWPTASALLHLAHTDRYPVLDFRALESLGVAQPKHFTHEFWAAYVGHCRGLADQTGLTMRDLRALWQWSYEN